MAETQRLKFIEKRDGKRTALEFAKRTKDTYRKAVLFSRRRRHKNPHHASLLEYRRGFIESYLSFKQYIRMNNVVTPLVIENETSEDFKI